MKKSEIILGKPYRVIRCLGECCGTPTRTWDEDHTRYEGIIVVPIKFFSNYNIVECEAPEFDPYNWNHHGKLGIEALYTAGLVPVEEGAALVSDNTEEDSLFVSRIRDLEL